jgi:hypothetical protein
MRVSRVISVLSFWFSSFSCLSCWHVVWQFLPAMVVVVWQLIYGRLFLLQANIYKAIYR